MMDIRILGKLLKERAVLLLMFSCLVHANGQQEAPTYPTKGSICPDFTLHNVHGYEKESIRLHEMEGKWTVLFFWTTGCFSAVEHLAEMYQTATAFQDNKDVQVFLVSKDREKEKHVDTFYQETYGYNVPSAFDDALIEKFGIDIFSYTVIINPAGTIEAICSYLEVDQLKAIMAGEAPELSPAFNREEEAAMYQFKDADTWLQSVGNDTVQLSILKEYEYDVLPNDRLKAAKYKGRDEIFAASADLASLYMIAYGPQEYMFPSNSDIYLNWWNRPVIEEGVDSTDFGWDYAVAPTLYIYDLRVQDGETSLDELQKYMQQDLKRYFGYEVSVEKREMPYWSLSLLEGAHDKLATKGGPEWGDTDGHTFFEIQNKPMGHFANFLANYMYRKPPVIDETGMDGNIDLKFQTILKDWDMLRAALKNHGLSLDLKQKPMNVVVVRKPSVN